MPYQDQFVGSVAIILGLALLAGSILDGPWLMQLAKPRLMASAFGKTGGRLAIGLVGAGFIALGIAIAVGWRVQWK